MEQAAGDGRTGRSVSVLFSEPKIPQSFSEWYARTTASVSVLFSEPKIPQWNITMRQLFPYIGVSVLFSEPKIPQSLDGVNGATAVFWSFSALQRAENSSI